MASPRDKRRRALRWIKRGALVLAALGVVGAVVVGLLPKPVEVDMVPVERGPMRVTVDEDGRTRVKDRYVVSAPLGGRVARIELDPGDHVKLGAAVARLVPLAPPMLDKRSRDQAVARVAATSAATRQSRAQIHRAAAVLELARADAKRSRALFQGGAMSRQELEQAMLAERTAAADLESARFGARVADYELEMARAALGLLTRDRAGEEQMAVTSPVDGRVLEVHQKSEGVVQPGAPLIEVGDPQALEIVVDVLTSDAVSIQPGATVTIERWGGAPLDAHVRRIEPSAFTRLSALGVEEQRVNVVIDLVSDRKLWTSLGDGYRVEARIVVWQGESVVKAPASAVFRHGDGWAVYRVEDGKARLQPVDIGRRNDREVQIVGGLAPPAIVVLHPSDRVADGVALTKR